MGPFSEVITNTIKEIFGLPAPAGASSTMLKAPRIYRDWDRVELLAHETEPSLRDARADVHGSGDRRFDLALRPSEKRTERRISTSIRNAEGAGGAAECAAANPLERAVRAVIVGAVLGVAAAHRPNAGL
jgi:hypothetical protein